MPDDPGRDNVVQKFRASENQYCAGGPPNLFCGTPEGTSHRGVDMHSWQPWPHIHGTPVFGVFPDGRAFLYVWAEKDFLKSFRGRVKRFETTPTDDRNQRVAANTCLRAPYVCHAQGLLSGACPAGCSH